MIKYAMVALAGILVGGASVWAMRGEATPSEGSAAEPIEPTGREPSPGTTAAQPETLAECRQELVRRDVAVRAAQATAARAVAKQLFDDDEPERGARRGDPGAPDVTTSATTKTPQQRAEQREEWRAASAKVHDAIAAELGITPEEEQSLSEALCPSRENQRSLFMEYGQGNLDTPGLFAALRDERSVSTEGLRQTLGAARFAKLDEVGGAGILARSICRRR